MLSQFRTFAKSWVAAVLIGLLVISFAVWGINDVFTPGARGDAVVQAGSRSVSGPEFRRIFDNWRQGLEQQTGQQIPLQMAVEEGLHRRLLEEVASAEALGALIDKMGVRPSDELVVTQLRETPAFFDPITGKFDRKTYEQLVGEQLQMSTAEFEAVLRDELAQAHFGAGVVAGLRPPKAYGALAAAYESQTRDVSWLVVTPQSVPEPARPTDAQLTAFMRENEDRLKRPEMRNLTVARFSAEQVAPTITISDAEVRERYEFRKESLSTPERRTVVQIPVRDQAAAEALAARLRAGEDPAAVARALKVEPVRYDDQPKSAIVDRPAADAAFALPAGGVSGPVRGELGFSVLKVLSVTPGRVVTEAEIAPQIRAELARDAAQEKVFALVEIFDKALTEGGTLAEAAKKAGVPVASLPPVTADGRVGSGQPTGLPPALLEAAFALPQGGETDQPIELAPGEYAAVRVDRIVPSALPPLEEARPQLTAFYMFERLSRAMRERAEALAARVRKGESLEAVARSAGATPGRAPAFARGQAGQTLSREAAGPIFAARPGEVVIADQPQEGVLVAKVNAVRFAPAAEIAAMAEQQRGAVGVDLVRELGDRAREAARREVKVRVNPALADTALGLDPADAAPAAKGKAPAP